MLVNLANLAVVDSGYCAVDPSDTVRIAVARETGSNSIGFAMDANAKIGGDEYLVGGGMAFKDNAALKDALAKGEYAVVSFWTLQGGRMVKTSRERAAFALLKKSQPSPQPQDGPAKPGAVPMISLVASFAVCALALVKSAGRI